MNMAAIPVSVRRREESLDLDADLRRARWLANLLDAQFSLAGVRFGLDAIVGLIPGIGDTAALIGALYPIYVLRKHQLDPAGRVERKMIRNIAIDYFIGLVPLFGDAFDVYFRANLKNLELLENAARGK
jgi:hypothetical protein